jgi:hypothetical protein
VDGEHHARSGHARLQQLNQFMAIAKQQRRGREEERIDRLKVGRRLSAEPQHTGRQQTLTQAEVVALE